MRENLAGWVQRMLAMLAIGLVASFFLFGMANPSRTAAPNPSPAPTPTPTPTPTAAPSAPTVPGVPTVPVSRHETWPAADVVDPDRQLSYEAAEPLTGMRPAPGDDLTGYVDQSVDWQPCHQDSQCATILVPLDWEDPGRAALEIAMRRVPSQHPTRGPIFVNPGGPGVAGADFAATVAAQGWDDRDVIGFDPRGTGASTRIACGTDAQTDALRSIDQSPETAAEKQALVDAWAAFARLCRDEVGDLLDHVTTIEVVRDMDLLRHLVGADKLDFFGVSYGTYLGAMYAELFPDRAGRLLLDSAVDITDDESEPSQAEGFELALRNYAKWCAGERRCNLGDDVEEVLGEVTALLERLDAEPARVGDRRLTASMALTGILLFLYADEEAYESLTFVIGEAQQGRYDMLVRAADELDGRGTHFAAFPAMSCADWPDEGIEAAFREQQELIADSPIVARFMGVQPVCETWTAASAPQLRITGAGAPPIVVVGTTGDSATPYQHAVSMAGQLVSGVLVTFEGAGHGSVVGGNSCLHGMASAFFRDGTVPADGTTCR